MLSEGRMRYCVWAAALLSPLFLFAHDRALLDHHWHLTGEFVYMRRSEIHNHTIVKDRDKPLDRCKTCPNRDVIDNKDLVNRLGFEPGFRFALLYMENPRSSFEVNFLYLEPWHAEKKVKGHKSLSFPFSHATYTHDYHGSDEARAEYEMDFWDLEFNYWRHFTPRYIDYFSLSAIFGLRYFHWNEGFDLTMTHPPDKSNYKIDTKNDIFGAQVGLDFQMNPTRWLSWEIAAKVGGMANHALQKTSLRDWNDRVKLRDFKRQAWEIGVFADVAATMGFQFKDHINIHAGYQVLFFSGLALAPEQTNKGTRPTSGDEVHTNGAAIIHGLFAGLTVSF